MRHDNPRNIILFIIFFCLVFTVVSGEANVGSGIPEAGINPNISDSGIQGRVFHDLNKNEVYEPGEPTVAGVIICISAGKSEQQAVSDSGGVFSLAPIATEQLGIEVLAPSPVHCYDPEAGKGEEWGIHNTIKFTGGQKLSVLNGTLNIPVEFRWLNYGPRSGEWELWRRGPLFPGRPNVILLHGAQLSKKALGLTVGLVGAGKVRGRHDRELQHIYLSLEKDFNCWEFEYADVKLGTRYWTHQRLEVYGERLATAMQLVHQVAPGELSLISHSMGGLVSRYALQKTQADCARLVTLNTGHFGFEGTDLPLAGSFPCVVQMRPGSFLLWDLNTGFDYQRMPPYLAIAATHDTLVTPSSAGLAQCRQDGMPIKRPAGSHFYVFRGSHTSTLKDGKVMEAISGFLKGQENRRDDPPRGRPYIIFRSRGPMAAGFPRVEINGKKTREVKFADSPKAGYYAWIIRPPAGTSDTLRIYYERDRYIEVDVDSGKSAIVPGVIEN